MSLRRWPFWMVWLSLAFVSSAAAQPEARQVLLLSSFQRDPIAVFNQTFPHGIQPAIAGTHQLLRGVHPADAF